LYGIRESRSTNRERVRAFAPNLYGVTEVLHATFTDHAYPQHSHGAWTVLIVDTGAVRYDIERDTRRADTRRVTVLPPYVAHNGESANAGMGFRKRVLYLEADAIGESLIGKAVDNSTYDDPRLRAEVSALHMRFDRARDDLEWETRLEKIIQRIQQHLSGKHREDDAPTRPPAHVLREYLDARLSEGHRLEDVARRLGWNKTHLIRSFTTEFGIPPHRYLISRRIEEARRRLLTGQPAADVAVDVGFYDQAHLTRHFRSHLATTPGAFKRSI